MNVRKGRIAVAATLLVAGTVCVNALWMQDGPHPAPLFSTSGSGGPVDLTPNWSWRTDAASGPIRYVPNGSAPQQVAGGEPRLAARTPELRPQPANDTAQRDLVRRVQDHLYSIGFYTGEIDGLDGPMTRAAVEAYQKAAGLEPTGRIDQELGSHIAGIVTNADKATGSGESTQSANVDRGDPQVRAIQQILADLGYAPGPVDGMYGAATREAIKRFEADRGMTVTGKVSDPLARELSRISGSAVPGQG